ncbi:MAG: fibronectin type III domain-containing protein [Flavobacteriales bacterium]|nr:fibronectin type III domain-containing protein [Flavobacteriales bacterium]
MKANIALYLSKLLPAGVLALLRNVVAKMTGNAAFATPLVPLADMTAKADELQAAIEEATFGSRQSKLLRDEILEEAKAMLDAQAGYVRGVCNGEAALLESSGFDLAKPREPIGVPGIPQDMRAGITNRRGELKLRWKSVHGARGYQVWMTDKDPTLEANWQAIGYTTRVTHLVDSLDSFKAYWFCVSAIGTAGEGMQSDPAMGRAA